MRPAKKVLIETCIVLLGAAATLHAAEQQPSAPLDEVVVVGTRLDVLRKQLIEAEDQFFDRYNELVNKREYEIHCRVERPIGSQIPRRRCYTGFEDDALAQAGGEAARMLQNFLNQLRLDTDSRKGTDPSVPLTMTSVMPSEIEGKRADFQRHMREVVVNDPDLLRTLVQHALLMEKYRQAELERFGPKQKEAK